MLKAALNLKVLRHCVNNIKNTGAISGYAGIKIMELFEDKITIFNVILKDWTDIAEMHERQAHSCQNLPGKICIFDGGAM